ncbi:MAG TPA: hypothetical protein VGC05_11190 [Mycobacterium sp.]
MVFDLDTISVQEIREQANYPGLRVRVAVSIGSWKGVTAWHHVQLKRAAR